MERCNLSLHRALRRFSVVCRYINIPILPRGDHGSKVALIRNSGARYLFGITDNQTHWVGKNEGETQSEKKTTLLALRFRSPPYGDDLPHTGCPSSPSALFPIAVAIPMKTIRWFGDGGRPALARAKVNADGLRDSWHSGGSEEYLVGRELPVLLEDPGSRGEEGKRVRREHPIEFILFPPPSPPRPGGIPVPHFASAKPAGSVSVSSISTRRELRPQFSTCL